MVANMEVDNDMLADMVADKVAGIAADMVTDTKKEKNWPRWTWAETV